jgi:hypothetical protein
MIMKDVTIDRFGIWRAIKGDSPFAEHEHSIDERS